MEYDYLVREGQLLESAGEFDAAAARYMTAVALLPNEFPAHVALQYLYPISLEQRDELIAFYRDLVKRLPAWNLPWGNLGDLLTVRGDTSEAIACYREAGRLRLFAKHPEAQSVRSLRAKVAPDFLIVGFPKCGTTALFLYLRRCPLVTSGHKKEIRFFTHYEPLGLEWYCAQFPPDAEGLGIFAGEATPQYAITPGVENSVAVLSKTPKIIFLTRDPIDRAISHYHQRRRKGLEFRALEAAFEDEIRLVERVGIDDDLLEATPYISTCFYAYHIARWRRVIPEERILILKHRDLRSDPRSVTIAALRFLGIDEPGIDEKALFPMWNVGGYPPPSAAVVSMLRDFFVHHWDLVGVED